MKRDRVILLKNLGGFCEGTWGTLLTYKDGQQKLRFRGVAGSGFKVRPGDKGRLFQFDDPGARLPMRVRVPFGYRPWGAAAARRLLTPAGKPSVYYSVCAALGLREAIQNLEADVAHKKWASLLKKGYTWEPVTLVNP